MRTPFCTLTACAALTAMSAGVVRAHGILGNRFFPPTVTSDDPFAVDELAFPTVSEFRNPAGGGDPSSREVDAGFEFDKEILPHLALGVSDTYVWQNPAAGRAVHGWDNLTLSLKQELWWNAEHEAIVSVGMETDIGGTGSHTIADPFTTFAPTFYFGKGFGDLPDALDAFKPFAVTGTLDQTFSTQADPNLFEWAFALEYNLDYLQSHVADIGLPHPLRDLIPLVEFSFATAENRDDRGHTTGTINPGVLWETPYAQLGAEAVVPVNRESGAHVGFVVQLWIFIDDLFPQTFGHPLFGERQ